MKKICLSIMLIIALSGLTAFAGDIPESYMHDNVGMFFGEVVYYHPDKETPSIQISPVKRIKGDVKEGELQTYTNFNVYGNIKLKQGEIYMFAYADEANGVDIFDVTTYNTKTLKLKNVSGDMWERFEKYINDGEYGAAKIGNRKTPDEKKKSGSTVIAVIVALAACLTGGTMTWKSKNESDK